MRNPWEMIHETEVTPITRWGDEPAHWPNYRSECVTCGTVLKLHDTEVEAKVHCESHQATMFAIEQFFVGRTNGLTDNKRNVLVMRMAKDMNPDTYGEVMKVVLAARREWLTWLTVKQREWQTKTSRRPARGRHHDSWSIREKYVRCAA
jgi:Zn ribbon nucleic-acid-binding protein